VTSLPADLPEFMSFGYSHRLEEFPRQGTSQSCEGKKHHHVTNLGPWALQTMNIDWGQEGIPGKTFGGAYAPAQGDSPKKGFFMLVF